jgi:hypothetical protein
MMTRLKENSQLVEEIQQALREHYPNLHLVLQKGKAEIFGTFVVYGEGRRPLDRYQVSIELPSNYPDELPIVREIGGRIPHKSEYHIESDGRACVLIPDDRWCCFPVGAPFIDYLKIPLHNFFLSQTVYAKTGKWPFGEWRHGKDGIYEYYRCLLQTDNDWAVLCFLHILSKNNLKKHYDCPCGSGKVVKACCIEKVRDLRNKISTKVAQTAMRRLMIRITPYKRNQRLTHKDEVLSMKPIDKVS